MAPIVTLKAGLQYSYYHSKLVHFLVAENDFYVFRQKL